MRIIIAWIKKYILHIHSPSASSHGYDFEYDWLKDMKNKRIQKLMQENLELRMRIAELEIELAESRAKEGKGALEKMIDGIADAVVNLGKMFSSMSPDELKALAEANDHDFDADCIDDCDFDCEHCERAKLDEEDDNAI